MSQQSVKISNFNFLGIFASRFRTLSYQDCGMEQGCVTARRISISSISFAQRGENVTFYNNCAIIDWCFGGRSERCLHWKHFSIEFLHRFLLFHSLCIERAIKRESREPIIQWRKHRHAITRNNNRQLDGFSFSCATWDGGKEACEDGNWCLHAARMLLDDDVTNEDLRDKWTRETWMMNESKCELNVRVLLTGFQCSIETFTIACVELKPSLKQSWPVGADVIGNEISISISISKLND